MHNENVIPNSILINWTHSTYGKQTVILDFYANPQTLNGVTMTSTLLTNPKTIGLLSKNYKAKLMEINHLNDCNSSRINKAIKRCKSNNKSLYHIKSIKQNEDWYNINNNRVCTLNRRFDD